MVLRILCLLVLLFGCTPPPEQQLVALCGADASLDAEPDSTPDAPTAFSLTTPWTRTVVTAGASTGLFRGADGVSQDSEGCWVTGWEEGGIVTRACLVSGNWETEVVATGLVGSEDAKAADLDKDGALDVVSCQDSGQKCSITFRGTPNVTLTLPGSQGHNRGMQAAIADINGDTWLDVVFGTRFTGSSPNKAVVGVLYNSGTRTVADWTYEKISDAGWVMSLVVVDGRIIVSDRASYKDDLGVTKWDLYGSRWLEKVGGVWVNHPISPPSGSGEDKTQGDQMLLRVVGNDVWDCTSRLTGPNRIAHHHNVNGDWLTWTRTLLPAAVDVGHCQGVLIKDVDADGLDDVVVSNWKGNANPILTADAAKSGVYFLHAPTWARGEISGPNGGKFDNIESLGNSLITTEQLCDDCVAGTGSGGFGVVIYSPTW